VIHAVVEEYNKEKPVFVENPYDYESASKKILDVLEEKLS